MSEDVRGRFHPSGILPDSDVKEEWIVKFPRGRTEMDRQILRAESVYYDIAQRLGCHTGRSLEWKGDCLFIPRFDVRPIAGKLYRSGLETIASALGKTSFGERVYLDEFAHATRQFSTEPPDDLVELFRRDILNVPLGNTDNHSRNTAFLKEENSIRLSPLYDFAPMMVDPEWIARECRWRQFDSGYPAWRQLARIVSDTLEEEEVLQTEMTRLMRLVLNVPGWLREKKHKRPHHPAMRGALSTSNGAIEKK
ncbi:MAG: HipA domain-containing protein [Victivallales bacterium]|nr:HipA domain-containing protein [Victivallales bacterium]